MEVTTSIAAAAMTSSAPNFGHLTTTFTPPPECATAALISNDESHGYIGNWGLECSVSSDNRPDASSCYPEGWRNDVDFGVFSPGSICPRGWHSRCSIERSDGLIKTPLVDEGVLTMWEALEVGQTAIGCCPEDFECDTEWGGLCTSSGAVGEIITAIRTECDYKTIHITFQKERLFNQIEASRVVLIQTAGSKPSGSEVGDGENDKGGAGTATHIKVAIGLSVPLAFLIAGITGFFLWRWRKRKLEPPMPSSDSNTNSNRHDHAKPELEGMHGQRESQRETTASQWQSPRPGTATGTPRSELASDSKDPALSCPTPGRGTRSAVYEMRGSETLAAELPAIYAK